MEKNIEKKGTERKEMEKQEKNKTAEQTPPSTDNSEGFDIEPLLQALGRSGCGSYQLCQGVLQLGCIFQLAFSIIAIVFIGYKPPYHCASVNASKLETMIGWSGNSTAKMAVEYGQCAIQVQINDSGDTDTFSLSCEEGFEYDGDKYASFFSEWDLTCEKSALTELTQTLMMVGQGLGAMGFTALADQWGRKPVYTASSLGMLVVNVAMALSPNYYFFIFCRVLTGALQQGTGLVAFTMFVEGLPREWRKLAGVLDGCLWSMSMMLLPGLAFLMRHQTWRHLQLVFAAFSAYSVILPWCLDESLRWLVANKKVTQTERVLKRACWMNGVHYPKVRKVLYALLEGKPIAATDTSSSSNENTERLLGDGINADEKPEKIPLAENDRSHDNHDDAANGKEDFNQPINCDVSPVARSDEVQKYSTLDIFRSKLMLKTTIVIAFLWITNSVTYYGLMMTSSSVAGNRFLNFFLQALMELPAYITVFFCLRRFGRRNVICGFLCIAATSLLLSSVLIATVKSSAIGPITNVLSLMGKYGISGSFSALFIFCPELFPTNMRTAGLGMSSAFSRFGAMVAPYTNNMAQMALWSPGILFGGMTLLAAFVTFTLPETRGRPMPTTIEDMEALCRSTTGKGKGKVMGSGGDKGNSHQLRQQNVV
ncbi:organic cation transporter protein-like [Babylonia areolata]|uniref:organic cation transporter protein-like n=1 Tax=Babylonia areolata TaxID=304850 RepID=UPI003FD49322